MKPRYAIIRVDNSLFCPDHYEKISNKSVCSFKKAKQAEGCDDCRYGDTKEQLVRKIAQVIKRERGNDKFIIFVRKKTYPKIFTNEDLAREIVEFLGVTE